MRLFRDAWTVIDELDGLRTSLFALLVFGVCRDARADSIEITVGIYKFTSGDPAALTLIGNDFPTPTKRMDQRESIRVDPTNLPRRAA